MDIKNKTNDALVMKGQAEIMEELKNVLSKENKPKNSSIKRN